MKSWRKVFGEAPAWLLIAGFSTASMLIGFDLAIFLAYYMKIESFATLITTALGSAIGAAFAASATLYAASYNQRRAEIRELRPFIRAVERQLSIFFRGTRSVLSGISQCRRWHMFGQEYELKMISDRIEKALSISNDIKLADELPLEITRHIEEELLGMVESLADAQSEADQAEVAQAPEADENWRRAEKHAESACDRIRSLIMWLQERVA